MEPRYRGPSSSRSLNDDYVLPSLYNSGLKENKGKGRIRQEGEEPSTWTLAAVILFVFGVFLWVRYIDYRLPLPLGVKDIQDNPKSFIEERARADLQLLTSVGPRVAGSYVSDVTTVDALTRLVDDIKRTKDKVHSIEHDVQKPKGSFHMWFQDGMTSSYSDIPNFIVKFSPSSGNSKDAILVNCHFDSVPASPGTSDDMISCAVMLEALRVLSRQSTPLRNSIVFLFNGAEENILQGAHGFLKGNPGGVGHKWSQNLKCFVNLEAAGAGFREILFQTGPGNPWLIDAYKKVPYPWGSVVGEEIFQRGLIPSDTDFRIFRDFGNLPGLDMAFVKNGYVYHTKFDNMDHLTPGSLQNEGSNVLALLEHLGNLDFLEVEYTDTKMVFFDVFGYFTLAYSEHTAIVMNIVLGLLVLFVGWREVDGSVGTLSWQIISTLIAWIAGIACSVMVGLLLNAMSIWSPYHSYPMLVFLLFGLPCVVGQVILYSLTLRGSEDYCWIAGKITLGLVLIVATFFTRIVFTFTVNLAFGMVGWYAARMLFKGYKFRLSFYLVVGEAVPLALSLYLVTGCVDTFVPIMGRSGSQTNPNAFLAVLTAVTLTLPGMSGIVPIFLFFKKTFLRASAAVMLIIMLWILLFIGRIPYQDRTPMRVHLIEVDRTFFANDLSTVRHHDAGFWLFNIDPNIPAFYDILGESTPELMHKNHEEIDAFHCEELGCGLPFIYPVKKLVRMTHWLPKPTGLPAELTHPSRMRMEVVSDSLISASVRRLSLSFVGPDHISINFSPGPNWDLISWSLTDHAPQPMRVQWKDRPTYFVYHARGVSFERFQVTLDFQRRDQRQVKNDTLVDINFSGFYLHGDEMKSQEMLQFIQKLPSWTYPLGFSGVSHVYSIPGNK